MRTKHIFLSFLCVTSLIPTPALAGHPCHGNGGSKPYGGMEPLAADRDGELTCEALNAPHTEKWCAGSDTIDADGDRVIGAAEWEPFLLVRGKRWQ